MKINTDKIMRMIKARKLTPKEFRESMGWSRQRFEYVVKYGKLNAATKLANALGIEVKKIVEL